MADGYAILADIEREEMKNGWPKKFNYAETKMGGSKPIKQKKGK